MRFRTLTEALQHHRGEERFVCFIEGQGKEKRVSFEELYRRAQCLLHVLQRHGMQKGDHLILFLNSNEQFIDVFWACLLGGIIPVPLAVGISEQHRRKVFNVAERLGSAAVLYTDHGNLARLRSSAADYPPGKAFLDALGRVLLSDEIEGVSTPGELADIAPQDTAFIQFSSGSTGSPKGVILKHRNLIANIEAMQERADLTSADLSLSWMPLTHDMGLIGFHLNPVVCNYSHVIMRTDLFVRRPLYWLIAAGEKQASMLGSPNFGYQHFLKAYRRKGLPDTDLSYVRLVFNGAEPISAALCEQFTHEMARFGLRRQSMFPAYGLAEACLAVSFVESGADLQVVHARRDSLSIGSGAVLGSRRDASHVSLVSVGTPVLHCSVRIAKRDGQPLPDGHVGHVHIRGANVTEQVIGDEGSVFLEGGWVDTGDLGFISRQGLFITGRYKEILFVHGQNYYPHDIEDALCGVEGLDLGRTAVAGVSCGQTGLEEVLVFVLHKGTLQEFIPLRARVKATVNEGFGIEVQQVIPVGKIPKTTSGKVQRSALANAYLEGEYEEILLELAARLDRDSQHEPQAAGDEIVDAILAVCREALPGKPFTIHDSLLEIGADSLVLVEIYTALDEMYPGALDITDLVEHPSIAALGRYLRSKGSVV